MQVELTKAEFDSLMVEQEKDEKPGINDDIEVHHLSRAAWILLRHKAQALNLHIAHPGQFSPKLWIAVSVTDKPIYCMTTRVGEIAVFN